jgi:hypothetical protein
MPKFAECEKKYTILKHRKKKKKKKKKEKKEKREREKDSI